MELNSALRTTAAIRSFTDEPVDDATLYRILDTARFAPSGGNRQAWRAIVVKDPGLRKGLRDLYLVGWSDYLAQRAAGLVPWAPLTDRAAEAAAIAAGGPADPGDFAANLDTVPALIVVLADLRGLAAMDRDHDRYTFAGGASVYPFIWSLLLAARGEGLGGVLTTMLIRQEQAVRDLLHVPQDYAVAALVALGHPVSRPTRLRRAEVADFATLDRLDGPPLS
jgi:nitroreductase